MRFIDLRWVGQDQSDCFELEMIKMVIPSGHAVTVIFDDDEILQCDYVTFCDDPEV